MSEEKSRRELEAQQSLQDAGVAIVSENPAYESGGLIRYRIVGKKRDNAQEVEVLGEDREHALTALVVAANAL